MTAHVSQSDIERLARNDLGTAEWGRVRRHLFECDSCLRRLIDVEAPRAATESTDGKRGGTPAQPRATVCRAYVY
jgi:hypothetical protein